MQAGLMAAVLATLVVVTSVGAYIQYTHAMEFTDADAQKRVSIYMAVSIIFLLAGLVLAPMTCFQAGVWSTRTGSPVNKEAAGLAYMPPYHVMAFYVSIAVMVVLNAVFFYIADDSLITGYETEESPIVIDKKVNWASIAKWVKWGMALIAVAAVVMAFLIVTQVQRAAKEAHIDMASGIALSVLKPDVASTIRARYA